MRFPSKAAVILLFLLVPTLVTSWMLFSDRRDVVAATRLEQGRLVDTGEQFVIEADLVLRAIGQTYRADAAGSTLALNHGRIQTDDDGQTSLPRVWAGGDCRAEDDRRDAVAVCGLLGIPFTSAISPASTGRACSNTSWPSTPPAARRTRTCCATAK